MANKRPSAGTTTQSAGGYQTNQAIPTIIKRPPNPKPSSNEKK